MSAQPPPVRGAYLRDLVVSGDPTVVYLADWLRILCLVLSCVVAAEVLRWSPRSMGEGTPRYWARVAGTSLLILSAAAAQYLLLHRPVTLLLPLTLGALLALGYGLAGWSKEPREPTRAALHKLGEDDPP